MTESHPRASAPRPIGSEPLLRIVGLNKWFGGFHALRDIELDVSEGERIVICGPSGSGKSTLIRCINRIETFEEGVITMAGVAGSSVARRNAEIRRQVGMVFQHFNLFPHMTVLENCVLAPMRSRRESRRQAEAFAMQLLDKVRIADQAKKYPAQLSGGQQQRVAIARALCMRPRLMLFDEPTSALDPEMVQEVLETLVALARDGMTMICVTHEMGFARQVADRVVFMDEGQVVEIAPPEEFFSAPAHVRSREFLGKLLHL
ncbi:MAG: amino acid ABC transporter ATP-binding protein [Burkholderiaceae bacterium]